MNGSLIKVAWAVQAALIVQALIMTALSSSDSSPGTVLFDAQGIPILDYSVGNYGQYAVFNPPLDILFDKSQVNQECTNTVSNINLSSQTSGWYCSASSSRIFVEKNRWLPKGQKTLHPRSHASSYSLVTQDEKGLVFIILSWAI